MFQTPSVAEARELVTLPGPKYRQAAKAIGLSELEVEKCINSEENLEKTKRDVELAHSLGVTNTPTIFINGWSFQEITSLASLRYELNYQLQQTRKN